MDGIASTQWGQVVQLSDQAAFKHRMRRPVVKAGKPAELLLFMGVRYEKHDKPQLASGGKKRPTQRGKGLC